MIAPITLVTAKVIPKRITDVSTVPKAPTKNAERFSQQLFSAAQQVDGVKRVMPKYPIAIPNNTHKNAGVIVTRAVKRKIAARTPMIKPAIIAPPVQLISQSQFVLPIYFTSAL